VSPEAIYQERFASGATPRSEAYRKGVMAILQWQAYMKPMVCPYPAGSAEFDAYWAGHDEGVRLWQKAQAASITDTAIRVMMGGERKPSGGQPMK
jgi:hypothetical protein